MASTSLARFGGGHVSKFRHSLARAHGLVAKHREKGEKVVESVFQTLEVQAAAFGFGMVQGAFYDPTTNKNKAELFGTVPVEVVAGVALHAAGVLGLGGKHSAHLHNLGDGALAAYASNLGRGLGYKFAKERKAGGSAAVKGLRDEVSSLITE